MMKNTQIQSKNVEAQIFSFKEWCAIIEPARLKEVFGSLLKESGFQVVKFDEHHFPVKGYTCFWLLAESHLAIHTFPDDFKTYIELSSCNEDKLKIFKQLFEDKI